MCLQRLCAYVMAAAWWGCVTGCSLLSRGLQCRAEAKIISWCKSINFTTLANKDNTVGVLQANTTFTLAQLLHYFFFSLLWITYFLFITILQLSKYNLSFLLFDYTSKTFSTFYLALFFFYCSCFVFSSSFGLSSSSAHLSCTYSISFPPPRSKQSTVMDLLETV